MQVLGLASPLDAEGDKDQNENAAVGQLYSIISARRPHSRTHIVSMNGSRKLAQGK
jgi:hypothetical protein